MNRYEFLNNIKKKTLYQKSHQLFLRNWLSQNTLHDSVLLYHSIGTGKTCTAIGISEGFKEYIHGLGRKIIIVASEVLQDNFKTQLLSKCTGTEYITDDERDALDEIIGTFTSTNVSKEQFKLEILKKVNKHINKYYTFSTLKQLNKITDFSNTVIIIDEAHTISNKDYRYLIEKLGVSVNYRLVLLTGTPVYDNCDQIVNLSNLLNANNVSLQISIDKFTKTKNLNPGSQDNILTNYKELLPGSLEKLTVSLENKVSFVSENPGEYPDRIYFGESLDTDTFEDIKVIKCIMSDFQAKAYDSVDKQTGLVQVSNIATAGIATAGIATAGIAAAGIAVDMTNDISKYSTKINKLIQALSGPDKQKSFVYSFYLSNIKLIGEMLMKLGYSHYKGGSLTTKANRFMILSGDNTRDIPKLIKSFNSDKNVNGEYVQIVIGSSVVTEGVTFKCTRQVHIMEPHWNVSKINQVIGRAIRSGSHNLLPPEQRNTTINKYVSVHPDSTKQTIDTLIYKTARLKSIESSKVLRLLKEISIDCNSNASRYKRLISNKVDGSEECDYQECELRCKNAQVVNYNKITYNLGIRFFDEFQIEQIKKYITNLFTIYSIWEIGNILSMTAAKFGNVSKEVVFIVLGDLVNNKIKIKDVYDRDGVVITRGPYYIFNADGIDINSSIYEKISSCDNISEKSIIIESKDETVKTVKEKTKKEISGRMRILEKRHIYGVKIGDKIGLCFKEFLDTVITDNRKACTGRLTLYSKDVLDKIVKILIKESENHRFIPLKDNNLEKFIKDNGLSWKDFRDIGPDDTRPTLVYLQAKVSEFAILYDTIRDINAEQIEKICDYLRKVQYNYTYVPYKPASNNNKIAITESIIKYLLDNNFISDSSSDNDDAGVFIEDF